MQYTASYQSPLGPITLASDGQALMGLWFDGQKYFADTLSAVWEQRDLPIFTQAKKWLDQYFQGKNPGELPPILLQGSPFRLQVWEILKKIPYGQVMTYGEIGALLLKQEGRKNVSARAVGGAVAHNPISIMVPCHRVVGKHGSLTGYAGGMEKKIALLQLEKVEGVRFTIPKRGTAL